MSPRTFSGDVSNNREWMEDTILQDVTASAAQTKGQLIYANGHWGWRPEDVASGDKGPLVIRGPVPIRKNTGITLALGDLVEVFLDPTAGEYFVKKLGCGLNTSSTARPRVIGRCYWPARSADLWVHVDLDPMLEQDYYTIYGANLIQDAGGASLEIDIEIGQVLINGNVIDVAAAANAATATVASAGKEKVGIVQIEDDGTISFKSGTEVTLGDHDALYPEPDADCMLLAKIATPASPILEGTTQITTAMIFNNARRRL